MQSLGQSLFLSMTLNSCCRGFAVSHYLFADQVVLLLFFFFLTSDTILLKIFSVHIKTISEIKAPMVSVMERSKRSGRSFDISILVAAKLQLESG